LSHNKENLKRLTEHVQAARSRVSGHHNSPTKEAALSKDDRGTVSSIIAVESSKSPIGSVLKDEHDSEHISLNGKIMVHKTSIFGFHKYYAASWKIDGSSVFNIYKEEDGFLDIVRPRNPPLSRATSNMSQQGTVYSVDFSTKQGKKMKLTRMKNKMYGNSKVL
jgi:hypothetical protein